MNEFECNDYADMEYLGCNNEELEYEAEARADHYTSKEY
tara:strand:+ start:399 stop:515 length:117 start_codon:yes stop_codon:yes gene_type:complete